LAVGDQGPRFSEFSYLRDFIIVERRIILKCTQNFCCLGMVRPTDQGTIAIEKMVCAGYGDTHL
jgi:hypothetical protein